MDKSNMKNMNKNTNKVMSKNISIILSLIVSIFSLSLLISDNFREDILFNLDFDRPMLYISIFLVISILTLVNAITRFDHKSYFVLLFIITLCYAYLPEFTDYIAPNKTLCILIFGTSVSILHLIVFFKNKK